MAIAAAALLLTLSCSYRVERNPFFDEESGPARTCVLLSDTTLLVVRDYFPGIGSVDGLTCDDYTVLPLSRGSMDSVLVVAGPASRNISTVRVTTGKESGVIVLKRENSYLVLWQNTLLGHKCLSYHKPGVFTVHIPDNAEEMDHSCIRIYSHNAAGAGSDITVPVRRGRVTSSDAAELS